MNCSSCNRSAVISLSYAKEVFCKSCFKKFLFKRVRRTVSGFGLLKSDDVVVLSDGSVASRFLVEFMEDWVRVNPKLGFVVRKRVRKSWRGKTVMLPTTLTHETNSFLHFLFTGEKSRFGPVFEEGGNWFVKPLIRVSCCDLRKLFGEDCVIVFSDEHDFISRVEERRPMARFSILNLILSLKGF